MPRLGDRLLPPQTDFPSRVARRHPHRRLGPAHGAPGQAQAVEGLGRGDLVDEVEVDVEQVGFAVALVDDVAVPDLLGQGPRPLAHVCVTFDLRWSHDVGLISRPVEPTVTGVGVIDKAARILAAVEALDGAFVYSLHDLEKVAEAGRRSREAASMDAWRILGGELDAFRKARLAREAGPVVADLRAHAERIRQEVLAEKPDDAEAATRLLLARLLHEPSEALRHAAAEDPGNRTLFERLLRRLFRLEVGSAAGGGPSSGRADGSRADRKDRR